MARYRKVDTRIWNDEKFLSLSHECQLLFFFLLTHPNMTALGAMRHTADGMAEEIKYTKRAFAKAFGKALELEMVKTDPKASFIWLPNFLKYNVPESPNVVKSWDSALDLLPECAMKSLMMEQVKGFVKGLGEAFHKALPLAFAKAMPNQEQEQEQEREELEINAGESVGETQPEEHRITPATAMPPTVEDCIAFGVRVMLPADECQKFHDYYEARGWMSGASKIHNWQAALKNWHRNWRAGNFKGKENGNSNTRNKSHRAGEYEENLKL